MRVFFDKDLVGSSKSFTWNDGQITLDDEADWRFEASTARHKQVIPTSDAAGCDLIVTPSKPHAQFWKKHTQHPAWYRIISKGDMTRHMQAQVDRVIGFLQDEKNSYYVNQYQRQQKLLDTFQPARATRDLEEYDIKLNRDGFLAVPKYDNISSATGRMSVVAGPRVLTMPRDSRGVFVSRWGEDGILTEIDYNSLELRVLAWIQGFTIENDDAYMWIAESIKSKDAPRHVIKEATLAAMYGMSRKNFALRYQDMPDAVDVYDNVRGLLDINGLEKRLGKGDFSNAFGRHLADTTARISHYVQSTAVDVACDGFMGLVDSLPEIVPCFMIHDAIIVDVHRDMIQSVKQACKSGLRVDIINKSLQVRLRRFGSE